MKGVVFTEFLSMVEEKFGYEVVDEIITKSELPNNGAYTSVGTYNHGELFRMILSLHELSSIEVSELVRLFGNHFFEHLVTQYRTFFESAPTFFDFLQSIHGHIHVEVKKLYPDAELPHFDVESSTPDKMVMIYYSERKLSEFGKGLMEKAAEFYQENIQIETSLLNEEGSRVRFTIQRL